MSAKRLLLPALICTGLASPTAQAAPVKDGTQIAVLPVRVEGEISTAARASIEDALVEGLAGSGADVRPPAETTETQGEACTDDACAAAALSDLGADYVAWVEIKAEGRDYEVSLRLESATGKSSRRDATCEICGFEEVAGTVRTAANDIAESLDSLDAPGKLIIESDPRGAELLVDGVVVGKTPLTYELASGTHVITLRKLGYATREQKVNVTSGVQERLSLNLTETKNIQRGKRVRAVGWTLVGVGAAGVIAGTTLLALHHEPVPSRCDDEAAIDVNGLCRWRYNLLAPGIGAAAVGAAGLIGGISLLTVGGKAKADERDTARSPRTQFSITPWSASVQHRF